MWFGEYTVECFYTYREIYLKHSGKIYVGGETKWYQVRGGTTTLKTKIFYTLKNFGYYQIFYSKKWVKLAWWRNGLALT